MDINESCYFRYKRESLIKSMADNMDYSSQEHPQIGIFWYDADKNDLFGVNKMDPQFLSFSQGYDGSIKQYPTLHKDIWIHEFKKGKDDRFVGDYTQIPRGRVCQYNDERGFTVYVGDWIDDYPQAKEQIIYEFSLPKDVNFIKDEHWNIGHGWSDEMI